MNYHVIRKLVEEEVIKALSAAPATTRIRRPVVSEQMITSAKRRGSSVVKVTPGSIVTPAARDRAHSLGVEIREELLVSAPSADHAALMERVMALVLREIEDRPRAVSRRVPSKKLITAADVEFFRLTEKTVPVGKKTRITPLAADLARRYGVRFKVES